jgi:hypothetical protein
MEFDSYAVEFFSHRVGDEDQWLRALCRRLVASCCRSTTFEANDSRVRSGFELK